MVDLVTEMTYRRLGDSGLVVSVVGIGCNNFGRKLDADGTRVVVDAALEAGINFFDTADIYGEPHGGSEELLGAALKGRRDDVVVATKFGMSMSGMNGPDHGARGARRYIVRAVEASLRRLDTDYIDLYQMHEPDPGTPIDETLAALHDLVQAGKVRYLGNSNFAGWEIADADWTARAGGLTPFISAQNRYSLLERAVEEEVVPACERFGLGLLPFFPLANGLLTGKYQRGQTPARGQPARRGWPVRRAARRRAVGHHRGDRRVRRRAGTEHAPGRDRRPGGTARGDLGDRRRHQRRTGPGQCRGRHLGALGRGSRRARRHSLTPHRRPIRPAQGSWLIGRRRVR